MWWLIGAVLVGGLLWLASKRGWIDLSNKTRSGGMGGALGAVDEVFAPTHFEAALEQEKQTVLPIPAPTPDGDKGIALVDPADADPESPFDGHVEIELGSDQNAEQREQ